MAYLYFVSICLVWAASFILMKKAGEVYSPVIIGAGRVLGGALALIIIWWWKGRKWSLRREDAGIFCVIVLLAFAWPYSIQPYLVTADGSAFIAMTVSFTPLMTILISIPLLKTWPTPRQFMGVLGALACLCLLMSEGLRQRIPWWHIPLAATVPFGYSLANTLVRRDMKHCDPLELTGLGLFVTNFLLWPLAFAMPTREMPHPEQWPLAFGAVAILGTLGTGIAMYWFNLLIQQRGPLFAGMITNIVPIGAVLWGLADGETITTWQIAALTGILSMVILVQTSPPRPA